MFKKAVLFSLICGMSACGSTQQPTASVPLVDPADEISVTPSNSTIQSLLNESNAAETSAVFRSAAGNSCRYLIESSDSQLYCKTATGQWFMVPNVMSNIEATQLQDGAKW